MNIFQALWDKSRRNIIELLSKKGQLTATDINKQFHISAPADFSKGGSKGGWSAPDVNMDFREGGAYHAC